MNRTRGRYVREGSRSGEWRRVMDLTLALAVREFKGQYRRSILGPAWAIGQPLIYLAIFLFLRGMFNIESEGVPYVIFAYSGLVPWTFFAKAVTTSAPSVYANAGLLKKMPVPREIFPLAGLLGAFVDFFIAAVILVGMMVWFRVPVGLNLLWLPVLVLLIALFAFGLGLLLAAVATYKRDILFALPFLMQIAILATPVMYPASQVPERWRALYGFNPMTGIVEGFRRVVVHNAAPDVGMLTVSLAGIVVVWAVGLPLFRSVSRYFADVL